MQNLTNEEQVVVIQARTVLTLAEKVTVDALGGGPGPFWLSSEEMLFLGKGGTQGGGMEAGRGRGPLSLAAWEAWHTHESDNTHQACLLKASSAPISPEAGVTVGLLEKFRE